MNTKKDTETLLYYILPDGTAVSENDLSNISEFYNKPYWVYVFTDEELGLLNHYLNVAGKEELLNVHTLLGMSNNNPRSLNSALYNIISTKITTLG